MIVAGAAETSGAGTGARHSHELVSVHKLFDINAADTAVLDYWA